MRHTCVTPCAQFLTRICDSVFQVVPSFQFLESKRGIYFCSASMSATIPAHFIVLGLCNVTAEKNYCEPKRTNLFYIHVIQSYLYLKSFQGCSHLRKATIFFVKSARLYFSPSGKFITSYVGGGITDICRENSSLFKI